MTDTGPTGGGAQQTIPPPVYPAWNLPTIYADNVANLHRGPPGVVKFYLVRFDPDMQSLGPTIPQAYAQVIMPTVGFAAMTIFFQAQLDIMINSNEISQDVVNQIREELRTHLANQVRQHAQAQQPHAR